MPEYSGYQLERTEGRTIVRLRVRPDVVNVASKALQLPHVALTWRHGNPAAFWFGPDQWLLISDGAGAADVLRQIEKALGSQLYAATDYSSGYVCYTLRGTSSRRILAMGCGIDMHRSAFAPGQCMRTRFAQVPLFIVATDNENFDLYIDRGYAQYLSDWLTLAGSDPIVREISSQRPATDLVPIRQVRPA